MQQNYRDDDRIPECAMKQNFKQNGKIMKINFVYFKVGFITQS